MLTESKSALSRLSIILVEPSHTGNIGSVARAMKTMGLTRLVVVNPVLKPDSQSYALASGAADILDMARFYNNLSEAIASCTLVVGTSARARKLSWPALMPEKAAGLLVDVAQSSEVALIFGRERFGLTNEELQQCHYHVTIPASAEYNSLNLAMAVQILTYEIRKATLRKTSDLPPANDIPVFAELERFYCHLEQTLQKINFIHSAHQGKVMTKLRRLYTRARPEKQELNILRGILTAINKHTS